MIRCIFAFVIMFGFCAAPIPVLGQIDKPVRGQKYTLAPNNGPWMIMVTSFSLPPGIESAEQIPDGMTPEQAADELVFELRTHGVPAYTFTLGEKTETIQTVNRLADPVTRSYTSQQKSVCVLAGNYQTIDPKLESSQTAIKTLEWIKKLQPRVLSMEGPRAFVMFDYSRFVRSRGKQRGPLKGAFFTTNPLASNGDDSKIDPQRKSLLLKLNSGSDVSLYENPGNFTLVVASFHGKKMMASDQRRQGNLFNDNFGETLNQAGRDAWELATYMRQLDYNAYVWHDTTCSIVTVGAFETLEDPRIPKAMETYRAKIKTRKDTGQKILTAEFLTLPHKPTEANPIKKRWIFDPVPRLMKVPVK